MQRCSTCSRPGGGQTLKREPPLKGKAASWERNASWCLQDRVSTSTDSPHLMAYMSYIGRYELTNRLLTSHNMTIGTNKSC